MFDLTMHSFFQGITLGFIIGLVLGILISTLFFILLEKYIDKKHSKTEWAECPRTDT